MNMRKLKIDVKSACVGAGGVCALMVVPAVRSQIVKVVAKISSAIGLK